VEPSCTKDRTKSAEPRLEKSKGGKLKPSQTTPKASKNGPSLAKVCNDVRDPEFKKSSTGSNGSDLHMPYTNEKLSKHAKVWSNDELPALL